MTLKQMRYTIAVAKYKSFNEAAKNLYVSQPSLTSAIHNLEEELNFEIFRRTRSGVELTDQGLEYLFRIQAIVEQVDDLEDDYKEEKNSLLYFSVSCQHYNFPVDIMLRILKEININYRFSILETKTKEVIEQVSDNVSEIGILYFSDRNKSVFLRELKKFGLSFHYLSTQSPSIYISKNHPLATKQKIYMKDLEPYPFVTFYQGEDSSSLFVEEIVDFSKKGQIIYIQDKATGWNILKHTDGYSIGSGILDTDWTKDIITIPLVDCDQMQIGWIQKNQTKLSEIADYFLRLVKLELQTHLRI
ncbi:hypothetical protein P261_01946 [Lachnospiraceae bacterium TWA4]|nr:hypothetical protein P261_01946 [Lachnospiraceae bacterium TWA4]